MISKKARGLAGTSETAPYDSIIAQASATYGVTISLINGVINAESNGRNLPPNSAGAAGIMQLIPGTASDLGVTDVMDPTQNINGGVKYLSQLLQKYNGDIPTALAAYNFGPGNVSNGKSWPTETVNYVNKILNFIGIQSNIGSGGSNVPSVDVASLADNPSTDSTLTYTFDSSSTTGSGDYLTLFLVGGVAIAGLVLLGEIL